MHRYSWKNSASWNNKTTPYFKECSDSNACKVLDQNPVSPRWLNQKESSLNSVSHFFIPEALKPARSLPNGLHSSFDNHLPEHWDSVTQEITHSLGCVFTLVITLHNLSEWAREKFSFQVQNPLNQSVHQCMSYCTHPNLFQTAQKIASRFIANQEKFTKMGVHNSASNHRRGELRIQNCCPSLSFRIHTFVTLALKRKLEGFCWLASMNQETNSSKLRHSQDRHHVLLCAAPCKNRLSCPLLCMLRRGFPGHAAFKAFDVQLLGKKVPLK